MKCFGCNSQPGDHSSLACNDTPAGLLIFRYRTQRGDISRGTIFFQRVLNQIERWLRHSVQSPLAIPMIHKDRLTDAEKRSAVQPGLDWATDNPGANGYHDSHAAPGQPQLPAQLPGAY